MIPNTKTLAMSLALAACTTPADVSKPIGTGKGSDAKVVVADTPGGFTVDVKYSRYQMIPEAALDVIASLPRFTGCPWLVPNPETKLPFVSIKRAWHGAREAAGLQGLRIHDLRHSAASFMVNSGVYELSGDRDLGARRADH